MVGTNVHKIESGTLTIVFWKVNTPTITATPNSAGIAQLDINSGSIDTSGEQVWTYTGRAGEMLTLRTGVEWDTALQIFDANWR